MDSEFTIGSWHLMKRSLYNWVIFFGTNFDFFPDENLMGCGDMTSNCLIIMAAAVYPNHLVNIWSSYK